MRVLVSGGAGFIGSHLVRLLLQRGHFVTVLDNFSTGKHSNLPANEPSLSIVEGDIDDPEALGQALSDVESVVHLAAVASVEASVRDPLRTHRTNLQGAIRLFHLAARIGVTRVIFSSSAAVYGDNPHLPLSESSELRPLSPYAADKLAGEHYLSFFHRSGSLNATSFRFFNVFGPRQDPSSPYSGVISIFLDRAATGMPITIFGDGKQTRDFIYVSDVANALANAVERQHKPREMPVYNVGRGHATDLLGLLNVVRSLPGVKLPLNIDFAPPRQGDIRNSVADVSRLLSTGWTAQTTIAKGLAATFDSTHVDA